MREGTREKIKDALWVVSIAILVAVIGLLVLLSCPRPLHGQTNKIDLKKDVKNVLPYANGGTGGNAFIFNVSVSLGDPEAADSGKFQLSLPVSRNAHMKRISCTADAGTVVPLNLELRSESDPNQSGTPMLTTWLECTGTPAVVNSTDVVGVPLFAATAVLKDQPLAVMVGVTTGTPSVVRFSLQYEPDAQ